MKKGMVLLTAGVFFLASLGAAFAGEKAPQKVVDLANTTLAEIGKDPVIVKAVKEENAKGKSLEQIKEMDAKWQAQPGIADYMQAMMESECGKHLLGIEKSSAQYVEIFVMDNQGANVAMTSKTSDYWQGDEAKFQKSFAEGKGSIFVDELKFDDSSQAYLVQVSVPVMDGDKAIGAITFGIDVEEVK